MKTYGNRHGWENQLPYMTARQVSHMKWLLFIPAMTAYFTVASVGDPSAVAHSQQVQFDVVPEIACRDITSPEFSTLNPDERLLDAHFRVSSLLAHSAGTSLPQYLVRIESVAEGTRVVDFAPRTSVATTVVGKVAVEDTQEQSAGGKFAFHADWQGLATLDVGAQQDDRRSAHFRYEMLPPNELVSASGTTRGGRGAYFKLRTTSQDTLEGVRDLQVTLRVPRSWRAERILVYCYAWPHGNATASAMPETDQASVRQVFSVMLYLEGDVAAKQAARAWLTADQQLRQVAWEYSRQRGRPADPSWKSVWSQIRGETASDLPKNWLQQVTLQTTQAVKTDFFQRLPGEIQSAAQLVMEAEGQLNQLSAGANSGRVAYRGL